jgi:carboxylesterase type B
MVVFSAGTKRLADIHSRFADVYMYQFDYVSPAAKKADLGAFHTAELALIFGNLSQMGYSLPVEKSLSEEMRTRFINFVKTGDPNLCTKPPTDVNWPLYNAKDPQVLRFNDTVTVSPLPRVEDLDFVSETLYGKIQ